MTDRSESARSDISGDPSSGAGSSNVICPNKIAKLSLVKFVANNIDVSFSYHQFERQKPMAVSSTATIHLKTAFKKRLSPLNTITNITVINFTV